MNDLLEQAVARQQIAEHILCELDLVSRWNQVGTCNLVGAVAYHLVVAPDIDMEIACCEPKIEDGFEIMRACALHPNVIKVRFWNALGPPHHGLYWQVRYDHEGEIWKIDMWSHHDPYSLPCGAKLVEPLKRALSDESRRTILGLKHAVLADNALECPSIQIYRAVLDSGVQTLDELTDWLSRNPLTGVVTNWKPGELA